MRYVGYSVQVRDPETDAFIGITARAFSLREVDQGHVSLTWVEHYGELCEQTYGHAASAFRDSLQGKKLSAKAYFAVGLALATRAKAQEHGKPIRIVHAPDGPNTGHVELRKFESEDLELLEALALDVFTEHIAVASLTLVPAGVYGPATSVSPP